MSRTIKRLVYLLLAVAVFTCVCAFPALAKNNSAVDAARYGVVRIVCDYSSDGSEISTGSGLSWRREATLRCL